MAAVKQPQESAATTTTTTTAKGPATAASQKKKNGESPERDASGAAADANDEEQILQRGIRENSADLDTDRQSEHKLKQKSGRLDAEDSEKEPLTPAPIAQMVIVKVYRPVKIGAGLLLVMIITTLILASMTSEWLGRVDSLSTLGGNKNSTTSFYRYGILQFCHGYLSAEGWFTTQMRCNFAGVMLRQSSWLLICSSLYGSAVVLLLFGLILLIVATSLPTENVHKWRLYKAVVALILLAAAALTICLFVWSVRFAFEVSINHPQRGPTYRAWPTTTTPSSPVSFMQFGPTKSARVVPPGVVPAAPGRRRNSGAAYYSPSGQNSTVPPEQLIDLHNLGWADVWSTVFVGWGYMLAWVCVPFIILPAFLIMLDGKKDEHICEENHTYP